MNYPNDIQSFVTDVQAQIHEILSDSRGPVISTDQVGIIEKKLAICFLTRFTDLITDISQELKLEAEHVRSLLEKRQAMETD